MGYSLYWTRFCYLLKFCRFCVQFHEFWPMQKLYSHYPRCGTCQSLLLSFSAPSCSHWPLVSVFFPFICLPQNVLWVESNSLSLWVWLLSLSIMHLGFICVVVYVSSLLKSILFYEYAAIFFIIPYLVDIWIPSGLEWL